MSWAGGLTHVVSLLTGRPSLLVCHSTAHSFFCLYVTSMHSFLGSLSPICGLERAHVLRVYAQRSTSFVITASGALYSWGSKDDGLLGRGSGEPPRLPAPVEALSGHNVHDLICCDSCCVAITGVSMSQLGMSVLIIVI